MVTMSEINLAHLKLLLDTYTGNFSNRKPLVINETTLRIDCESSVGVIQSLDGRISLPFGEIGGDFNSYNKEIYTLENAPTKVYGNFGCGGNKLTSLQHGPLSVSGGYYCQNNKLESLNYSPMHIIGDFNCSNNQLTSLRHGPAMVSGEYDCHSNQLTSFEGLPGVLGGGVNCSLNPLTSLKGLDFNSKIEGLITITYSENLPLLRLCVSNYQVDTCNEEVNSIINHCIKSYPNLKERIIKCQYALIKAGFKNNAKW